MRDTNLSFTAGWPSTREPEKKPKKAKRPTYAQLLATLQRMVRQDDVTPWLEDADGS